MKKNLLKNILLLGIILLASFTLKVDALVYVKKSDHVCTLTDAYKAWDKLSDKEKKGTIMPIKCKESVAAASGTKAITKGVDLTSYITSSRFSLLNVNGNSYVTPVKSQLYENNKESNMCWTFAANAVVETSYLLNGGTEVDLSEKHIAYSSSRTLEDGTVNPFGYYGHTNIGGVDTGGSQLMVGAYFAQRRGPVLESNLPFATLSSTKANTLDLKPDYSVENVYFFMNDEETSCGDPDVIASIKSIIVNYGAAASLMNQDVVNYKSSDGSSFYYNGDGEPTHALTIIGWDDEYAKENFSTSASGATPPGNGAWIIKNTYPTIFSSDVGVGYHYISYYDATICQSLLYVDGVEDENDYILYATDKLGFSDFITSPSEEYDTVYYKQVYEKKSSGFEKLESINLFGQPNDTYELYYSTEDNFNEAVKIGEGTFEEWGYVTVPIANKIISTDNFYIYLKYTSGYLSDGSYYFPAYVYYPGQDQFYYRDSFEEGVSYYSFDGVSQWIDSTSNSLLVLYPNIYAFTTTGSFSLSSGEPVSSMQVTPTEGYYYIPLTITGISLDDISVSIFNENSVDVTNKFMVEKVSGGFNITPKSEMVNPGNYTVTFDALDLAAQAHIVVYSNPVPATSIAITGHDSVTVNGNLTLTATVLPENATNKVVTWSSSDTETATVSDGVVTGKKLGTVTITATTTDGTNLSTSKTITVVSSEVLATSVEINGANQVNVAGTITLTATVLPENATNKVVTWTSSNDSIATVSAQGVVTGVAAGTVTITATTTDGSNKSASKTVTVKPVSVLVSLIRLSGLDEVSVNGTLNLSVDILPTNATNRTVEWVSGDTSIATVDSNGVVTGKKAGKVTITVKSTDGSNLRDSMIIKVIDINKEEGQGATTPTTGDTNPKTGDFKDVLIIMLIATGAFGVIYMRKKGIIKSI